MALTKLAHKCQVCPDVDTCDHKEMEMYGFLPIPEGGFQNPDIDIKVGLDLASGPDFSSELIIHMDELKRVLERTAKESSYEYSE